MRRIITLFLLPSVIIVIASCNRYSNQDLTELVWTACEPFDSLDIYVWHTVYNGTYIGNYCLNGEMEAQSFGAKFDVGLIRRIMGGNLDRIPIKIIMPEGKDGQDCCLTDVIRLMRKKHIVKIEKGHAGVVFVQGDLFHQAKVYKQLRTIQYTQ